MFGLLGANTKEKLCLVFDIGNASVSASLALLSPKTSRILYTSKKNITPYAKQGLHIERLISALRAALINVSYDIAQVGFPLVRKNHISLPMPRDAHLFISAPWAHTLVKHIQYEESKPFFVNETLLTALLQKELERYEKNQFNSHDNAQEASAVLEHYTRDIRLNGYPTKAPFKKYARAISYTLYISLVHKEIIETLLSAIKEKLHLDRVRAHSFMFSFCDAISDMFPQEKKSILVDVSGEITEIGHAEDGSLREVIAFPVGQNTLMRAFASRMHESEEEARSLLALHKKGFTAPPVRKKIELAFNHLKEEWLYHAQNALEELDGGLYSPRSCFLLADAPLNEWFGDLLREKLNRGADTIPEKPFVRLITKAFFEHIVKSDTQTSDIFDVLGTLFAQKLEFKEGVDSVEK